MDQIRLLVVDDNADDCELLMRSLGRAAGERIACHVAGTCEEALDALAGSQFDCALLDYSLPDCSGPGLLDRVRERFGALPCSMVMLTGMPGERTAIECMKAGAFDYFNKSSYLPEDLLYAVEQATQVSRLRRELTDQSSRRAQVEAELREAQLHSAELAGMRKTVATFMHELNSPLTGLLNCVDMLLSDSPKPGHEQWLGDMQEACRKMALVMRRMSELEDLRQRPGSGPQGPLDISAK